MGNPKSNEYGMLPQYEVGDTVRIWPIYKNPVGTVEAVVDPSSFPIKYMVRYTYHSGGVYVEDFAGDDLTLVQKRNTFDCNCKTVSDRHSTWCNRYNKSHRW